MNALLKVASGAFLVVFIAAIMALIMALFVWFFWNAVIPDVIPGVRALSLWQAFCMSFLSSLLFKNSSSSSSS